MNRITVIGNLTGDPQSHTTQDGKNVCNFSVAANRKKKIQGQPEADFFRVAAWGKTGEACQKYLAKGRKVAVVGSVSVSTYTAQDGTFRANMEVFAEDVEFLTPGNQGGTVQETAEPEPAVADLSGGTVVDTDELPF